MSKLVDSDMYSQALVPYIEGNPVQARMVERPEDYEFSSAFYCNGIRPPRWLSVALHSHSEPALTREQLEALSFVLETRLESKQGDCGHSLLMDGSTSSVRRWMIRKAELADGTSPGLPVCDPQSVFDAVKFSEPLIREYKKEVRGSFETSSNVLLCGLLRDFCGLGFREIGNRMGRSESAAWSSSARYRQMIVTSREFENIANQVGELAFRRGPFGLLRR
jgi:hypothetical protein